MKILTTEQIRQADAYTIEHEPIGSLELMERAAEAFVDQFLALFPTPQPVAIFSGVGNNGGDGLAIGRLLTQRGWMVSIFTIGNLEKNSDDFLQNFRRLPSAIVNKSHLEERGQFPDLAAEHLVIDGLFGSGLDRPVEGVFGQLIQHLNQSPATIVSIDLASGLTAEGTPPGETIIEPAHTISFQLPKLAFFQPMLSAYVGTWHVVDIGLNRAYIAGQSTDFSLTEAKQVSQWLPQRMRFDHKGKAGQLLLVAGGKTTLGASLLSAEAALRAGTGLLYVHTIKSGRAPFLHRLPEAMVYEDKQLTKITDINTEVSPDALAMGPGVGTDAATYEAFKKYLTSNTAPLVLDADGLNLLAAHEDLYDVLPAHTILTPHPGEFRRLVGNWKDDYEKLVLLKKLAVDRKVTVVLKGAFTAIAGPDGKIVFNPTGNPGMATAGSGDVLTGVIGGLLAQGVEPLHAAILGTYLHGKAGDLAAAETGMLSLLATDIIRFLPGAIRGISER